MTLPTLCGCFLLFSVATATAQVKKSDIDPPSCLLANRKEISLVVTDKGRFVDNLRRDDLAITVNDLPAEVLRLEPNLDQPLSVVILIDTSMSQQYDLMHTKLAAQEFVDWLMRTKKHRAAVVSFSGEATVEEELTGDYIKLLNAIDRVKPDRPADYSLGGVGSGRSPPIQPRRQGTTALWDAVWASADGILKTVTGTRRVILLLTDGDDNSSRIRMQETIQHVAALDVSVFAIGTRFKGYYLRGRHVLTELSEDTGGRGFFLKKLDDYPAVVLKVEQELGPHYLLSYCAATEKTGRSPSRLKVEIKNPKLRSLNLHLSYRRYG